MRRFTQLYLELDRTTRTSEKLATLRDYFAQAPRIDSAWAVYLLSGRKIGKAVSSSLLRKWAAEVSGFPLWIVEESYSVVGDLSETLSLILPAPKSESDLSLHEIIAQRIKPLAKLEESQRKQSIVETWSQLTIDERLVFHKLLSGNFRVGASKQLLIRALAEVAKVPPATIAHRLAGDWQASELSMKHLLAAYDADAPRDPNLPYPFMLAHPLHGPIESLGKISDWLLEWKWDGIRAQLLRRENRCALWSRGDEMVTSTFPEIIHAANELPPGTVLDGEIVAWDETGNRPLPFTRLQRRLNRKNVELSLWPDVPVKLLAFDLLEFDGEDVREKSLSARRELLENLLAKIDSRIVISSEIQCDECETVARMIAESRERGVEGLMLKLRDSKYQPGRPTGLWWKLKVQPYTVDAVLIAAEPGRGKRAGLLTDYTFAVWHDGALVPITKAYSGLTDKEIAQVDRFVRASTIERFGPVRSVTPQLVFELGFEAIQKSDRHKSGLAVRFPRMLRMRSDKKPADADSLDSLRKLLDSIEAPR